LGIEALSTPSKSQQDYSHRDEGDPEPIPGYGPFTQKDNGKERHQHDAEFVDRRHVHGIPDLQRTVVTDP